MSGFVGVSLFVKSEVVEATTIGDDYPVKWKNLPLGGAIDDWRMYTRYCTSFVAYRLSTANNFELQVALEMLIVGEQKQWREVTK